MDCLANPARPKFNIGVVLGVSFYNKKVPDGSADERQGDRSTRDPVSDVLFMAGRDLSRHFVGKEKWPRSGKLRKKEKVY